MEKGNPQKALEYEIELQRIKYEPDKLSSYIELDGEFLSEIQDIREPNYVSKSEKWFLSFEKAPKLKDNTFIDRMEIDLDDTVKELNDVKNTETWAVDLTSSSEIKAHFLK